MKKHTQNLPGIITGELETIIARGHELRHLEEKLRGEGRRIITLSAVCCSSWRCTIARCQTPQGKP